MSLEENIDHSMDAKDGQEASLRTKLYSSISSYISFLKADDIVPLFRVGLSFAIFAVLISFIVGILNGVGFLTILFRMFIVGVIFLFFGIGLALLLKYFVPDIFSLFAPEVFSGSGDNIDVDGGDDIIGVNLDYTLEDDEGDTKGYKKGDEMAESDKPVAGLDYNKAAEDARVLRTKDGGKVSGKKVGLGDFNIPQEPELLANAVKTLINKDN